MAGAGDGDVPEAGVEQVRVNAGIGVDQDALGGESLGAVAGYGIPVIKVPMFFWIEFNLTIVFESADDAAIRIDPFNHRKVAIGDAKRPIGCGELDAFADTELAVDLSLSATTLKLFGARIDGTEVDLWRLRPVKHHAPRHECQNAFASVAVEPHDWLNAFR